MTDSVASRAGQNVRLAPEELRKKLRRTARLVVLLVVCMVGLAFAAVPAYQIFCQITGFGGTPLRADQVAALGVKPADREVTVYFDANVNGDMPWTFKPVVQKMRVRIGEPQLAYYRAHNPTSKPVAGTATFNVTPLRAGPYFVKIECFCFQQQLLKPGETVDMPVQFYVDPAILKDDEMRDQQTITLSYTFFRRDKVASKD
ncbi:MAG: cytochrome c oxidase assembly protein [Neomegalonema sp.]|nr:cytochrome c oxidase assembly protein [Neomegalonema sp.]